MTGSPALAANRYQLPAPDLPTRHLPTTSYQPHEPANRQRRICQRWQPIAPPSDHPTREENKIMATPTIELPAQAVEAAVTASPWDNPPVRTKTLRRKRAERQARQAEHWGRRLEQAMDEGPDAVAEVSFDRLRAALSRLPEGTRFRAFEAVVMALDTIRETHAE